LDIYQEEDSFSFSKNKHLFTKFIKFLFERNLEDPKIDNEIERPFPDEESEKRKLKCSKK
jgi:hypothetical protein